MLYPHFSGIVWSSTHKEIFKKQLPAASRHIATVLFFLSRCVSPGMKAVVLEANLLVPSVSWQGPNSYPLLIAPVLEGAVDSFVPTKDGLFAEEQLLFKE